MSERFTKVFTLSPNLYAETSPVLIEAGAITKDNQTGKVFAQLKIRNITKSKIQAMTVELNCNDTAGNPIGDPVVYQYLDLDADYQTVFGSKSAIFLPDSASRSFTFKVSEIVFEDLSSINLEQVIWEPLPKEKELLSNTLGPELLKQYQITYGKDCKYKAILYKDLWQCSCGHFSKKDHLCPKCGNHVDTLLNVNLEDLQKECDDRLEAEAKQAEEERINAKKTRKKLTIAAIIAIPVLIVLIIIGNLYADYYEVLDSDFYTALIESSEEYDSIGFDSTIDYDFFGKKISINLQEKEDREVAIYDPNTDIILEQYNTYLSMDSGFNQITATQSTIKERGYDLDLELNCHLNDEAKTLFMASKNGETTHLLLDMAKEKEKLISQVEQKIQTLLDEKKYDETLDYIDDNIFDSRENELYITLKDSAIFTNAKNYIEAINKYNSNSSSGVDLSDVLEYLDKVDDSFLDTKDLKKTVKDEYDKIKSFSGTYTKLDENGYTDFIKIKDGKISLGTIFTYIGEQTYGTSSITQKKNNGKITYLYRGETLSFNGNQVTIGGTYTYSGTYTKK